MRKVNVSLLTKADTGREGGDETVTGSSAGTQHKPQLGFVEPTPEEIKFWTNYPQQEMKSRGSTGQSESTAQSIRPLCQLWYKIIP